MSSVWTQLPAQSSPAAEIEPVKTSITVVEKLSTEAPASMTFLDTPQIRLVPGVNLDDRLRIVPGFSLFRRASGLVAHPTTQGISLRGLGSTGASRTLVLWDGVPINDPFGGWVYWTRVSPEEVDRIEVSRGASTSIFGDRAMGGVIALFSRAPERGRFTGGYEFGNRDTHNASAGYSHVWPRFALSGQGRAFTTDGYFIVPEARRGRVDQEAGVRFVAADTRFDYLGGNQRLFMKADILTEDRANGTVLQRNSTGLGTLAANYFAQRRDDTFSVLGYHTRGEFHSSFSSIAANRATESISFFQTVPFDAIGAAGFWRHSNSRWNSMVGADLFRVEGYSIETFPAIRRVGGGVQTQHGTFLQGDIKAGPARFFLGARHHFTGQDRQFFSPSAGLTAGRGRWRARGSVYRSFRAPTLNELFREFRQGNAVTLANDLLKPESVFGSEAGLDFIGESSRVGFTLFRNDLRQIITNVTLRSTPAEIVRQRRNAAQALARGVEADFRHRWREWSAELAYLFADSRFSTALRTPQIPKHQGSAQLLWHGKRTLASFGFRSYSFQFEDDLNRFLLPGFGAAHVSVRQQLWRGLSALLAFENLFNREYVVGFSPTPLVGSPRLWRAGLRWEGKLR